MNMHSMNILDSTGHTTVAWDSSVPAEVESAKATFESMTAKGFQAFGVGKRGQQSERMDRFDPEAEQMILVPKLAGG